METFHIHIKGRVQGVGFRPFVYKLAHANGLRGWVCNATDGVHIRFNASQQLAEDFYKSCLHQKPVRSVVTDSFIEKVDFEPFSDFQITESRDRPLELSITPDFAMCPDWREELEKPDDRRHQYAFITCTVCGPRFSIISGLPYDRELTAMEPFHMCHDCEKEYHDPRERRYFSQTNSCPSCGVQLNFSEANGSSASVETDGEIIDLVVSRLRKDDIVAVKGIGGYLLLCSAQSKESISKLRQRKRRPSKPFALLYESLEAVENAFAVSKPESSLLNGSVSPIVLLRPKENNPLPMEAVAPGLEKVGVMIPYAPILAMIARKFEGPLIATSANLSGAPIVHSDDEAGLFQLADAVLSNNRKIEFPQDDSVVHFSPWRRQQITLRRSRGMAPSIFSSLAKTEIDQLALGAEMKGTFAYTTGANTYVSQYLGNLNHYDNQVQFETVLGRFERLIKPDVKQIAVDAHPGYYSHQLGKKLAEELGIALVEIPHHEAHFAAILAERKLVEEDRVLGVIWDGTGYGADGHSWGGEFFDYSDQQINRVAHLAYYPVLSHDRMAIDNRLCALALTGPDNRHHLKESFNATEWNFYRKNLQNPEVLTSSMGRVFDAVAFITGVSKTNTYEGQSAMLVEQDALRSFANSSHIQPYPFEKKGSSISLRPMFDQLYDDKTKASADISARFHLTLVDMIRSVATEGAYQKIAFSGGVFQNGLLVDLILNELDTQFELYFHRELSPNDENIAYGQLAHLQYIASKQNRNFKFSEQCV